MSLDGGGEQESVNFKGKPIIHRLIEGEGLESNPFGTVNYEIIDSIQMDGHRYGLVAVVMVMNGHPFIHRRRRKTTSVISFPANPFAHLAIIMR